MSLADTRAVCAHSQALSVHFSSCTRGNHSAELDPAMAPSVVNRSWAGLCFHLESALVSRRLRFVDKALKKQPFASSDKND